MQPLLNKGKLVRKNLLLNDGEKTEEKLKKKRKKRKQIQKNGAGMLCVYR